jgi:ankyrin repeat protein/HEAT repeat protein
MFRTQCPALFTILLLTASRSALAQTPQLAEQLYRHSWSGNAKEVQKLLEAGADPNAVHRGMRPLHKAAVAGHVEVLRLLIDHGAEVNVKDSSGRSPLLEAAGSRNPKAVEILLAAGAKPDGTELGHACWLGRTEAVNLLLAAGAPPDGGLPQAAQGGHVELVQLLLDKGARVQTKSPDGSTPLHLAALQGGFKTVELLLKHGADPNKVNQEGNTSLHMAISGDCDLETIKLLVESGAKLNIANDEALTPVRLAGLRGEKSVYTWLFAAAGSTEPQPARDDARPTATKSNAELIAILASDGSTLAERDDQRTALRELVLRGKEIMPEVLASIEKGVEIERFYELFAHLGPQADAALPVLRARLADKRHAFIVAITLERMHRGAIGQLPLETQEKAAHALYEATLVGGSGEVVGSPASTLIQLGSIAQPYVLKLLKSNQAHIRRVAASGLATARFADTELQAELIRLLQNDSDNAVREEAAQALGSFGAETPEVKKALLAIIQNPPPFTLNESDERKSQAMQAWRRLADQSARSLVRFGPGIIEDLTPLLTPIDATPRFPAMTALVSLGKPAVPRLIELLDHKDRAIAISASVALNRIGTPAVPALAEVVKTGSPQAAERAASALWWIRGGAKAALPTLYEVVAADNRSDSTKLSAAWAALRIDPAASRQAPEILAAIPLLMRMLDRGTFEEQGHAAEALQGIGPAAREALPLLRKRLELPAADVDTGRLVRDYVRREAQAAIAAIEAAPE